MKMITSQDLFEVKDTTEVTKGQQKAIVTLYGYSLPERSAEEQPFITKSNWKKRLKLTDYVVYQLYHKGLIERKGRGNWGIRLTGKAFENVVSKRF